MGGGSYAIRLSVVASSIVVVSATFCGEAWPSWQWVGGDRGTNLETHAEALTRCSDWLEHEYLEPRRARNVGLGQLFLGQVMLGGMADGCRMGILRGLLVVFGDFSCTAIGSYRSAVADPFCSTRWGRTVTGGLVTGGMIGVKSEPVTMGCWPS